MTAHDASTPHDAFIDQRYGSTNDRLFENPVSPKETKGLGDEVYKHAWAQPKDRDGDPHKDAAVPPSEVSNANNITSPTRVERSRESADTHSASPLTRGPECCEQPHLKPVSRESVSSAYRADGRKAVEPAVRTELASNSAPVEANIPIPRVAEGWNGGPEYQPAVQKISEPAAAASQAPAEGFIHRASFNQGDLVANASAVTGAKGSELPPQHAEVPDGSPLGLQRSRHESAQQLDPTVLASSRNPPESTVQAAHARSSNETGARSVDERGNVAATPPAQHASPSFGMAGAGEGTIATSHYSAGNPIALAASGDGARLGGVDRARLTGSAAVESSMACPTGHFTHNDTWHPSSLAAFANQVESSHSPKPTELVDRLADHKIAQPPLRQAEPLITETKHSGHRSDKAEQATNTDGKTASTAGGWKNVKSGSEIAMILEDMRAGRRATAEPQVREPISLGGKTSSGSSGGGADFAGSTRGASPKTPGSDVWVSGSGKSTRVSEQGDSQPNTKTQSVRNGSTIREQEIDGAATKTANVKRGICDEQVANTTTRVRINDTVIANATPDKTVPVKDVRNTVSPIASSDVPGTRSASVPTNRANNGDSGTSSVASSGTRTSGQVESSGGSQKADERNEAAVVAIRTQGTTFEGFSGVSGSRGVATDTKTSSEELHTAINKQNDSSQILTGRFPTPGEPFIGSGLKAKREALRAELQSEKTDNAERPFPRLLGFGSSDTALTTNHASKKGELKDDDAAISSLNPTIKGADEVDMILNDFCLVYEPEQDTEPSSVTATSCATSASQAQLKSYVTKHGDTLNSVALIAYGKPLQQLTHSQQYKLRMRVPLVALQEQTSDPALLKVLPAQHISLDAA